MMMDAQENPPPRNGRVITTDADYAAASDYLNGHLRAMQVAMLTTPDNHSASLASAYIAGEALARNADQDAESDGDGTAGGASPAGGSGTLAFALLAFLIASASLAALALYLAAATHGY